MLSRKPKRQVPTPEPITSHASVNPMFHQEVDPGLQRFRRNVLFIFGAVVLVGLIFGCLFGPWIQIQSIRVQGTRQVDPNSVQRAAEKFTQGRRWLLFPHRNLFVLSETQLSQTLRQQIQKRLSVEEVIVQKHYPHEVIITVHERTAIFEWVSGEERGTFDRQGVIIERLASVQPTTHDQVHDLNRHPFQVNQRVLKPEVVDALQNVRHYLRERSIQYSALLIPQATCAPVPDTSLPITNTNAIRNINSTSTTNRNTNSSIATGDEALPNKATNDQLEPSEASCDLLEAQVASQEIHVQLTNGPIVYFDRHQNLQAAVSTLQRVLEDENNRHAHYIDLRFDERVFIQ